jgi:3-oxoacyl-[acyl-carrier protein] reductase
MKARFDASGDVIVITGGANGIGAALALACAESGARVVVCDIDRDAAVALAERHPGISPRALDVSDRDAVDRVVKTIEAEFGRIDGLVCGAAIQRRAPQHEADATDWTETVGVNLNGVVWCYRAVVPGMIRRRRGSIVAFSSGLAATGWPNASAYASTKAALGAFVRSVAKEVAAHRVRVNLIAPGVIDTPQYRAANAGTDAAHWRSATGVGTPDDVIGPLMFLLSDAATLTGSLLSREYFFPARDDHEPA